MSRSRRCRSRPGRTSRRGRVGTARQNFKSVQAVPRQTPHRLLAGWLVGWFGSPESPIQCRRPGTGTGREGASLSEAPTVVRAPAAEGRGSG